RRCCIEHHCRWRASACGARQDEAGASGKCSVAFIDSARLPGVVARLHGPEPGGLYAVLQLHQDDMDSAARRGVCGLSYLAIAETFGVDADGERRAAGAALLMFQPRQRLVD